jgi:putative membrane protein (TIGR04086 family)
MTDKLVKSVITSFVFALVSSLFVSLIIASLLYFEIVGIALAAKILYGAFVVILFITSFITARKIGSRGLLIGLCIAGGVILFGALYRFIGIEAGVGLPFAIRSAVISLVAIVGAVAGVNTAK